MAQVDMKQVKELRDRTQAGLNDCRSALMEAEGDMEKAVEVILKKGLAKSAKRAGMVAAEGVVATRVSDDGLSAVVVEVNIQTDFAARNEDYLGFVDNVVRAAESAEDGADLGAQPLPGGSGTVEETRAALVGRLGENITVRRWQRVSVPSPGRVASYIHMGGKIGVILALKAESAEAAGHPEVQKFLEETAMQIAAMNPPYLRASEIPEAEKKQQGEIFAGQLAEEGKIPQEKWPSVVEGKLSKWAKEVCLLDQPSVLEPKKTVEDIRREVEKTVGAAIEITKFVRFERGEGIAPTQGPDFASEVAAMASN